MTMPLNRFQVRSWMRYVSTPLLVLLFLLGSSWSPAHAAETIVVGDGTPESCTEAAFLQALVDAPAGGIITFNCGQDPVMILITNNGDSTRIDKDLTIDGGGLVTFTGLIAEGGYYGYLQFLIPSAVTVNFLNLSVTNGGTECEGAIYNFAGTLTLRHVTVSGNTTGHGCGGGGIINGGTLTIEDSIITGNSAGCWGWEQDCGSAGGIANYGNLHLVNSMVSGNSAGLAGGGIWNLGTATIESSTISGNSTGCKFEYNDETGEPYLVCNPGGGILNSGTLRLINSTVSGNSTGYGGGGSGGGIYNSGELFLQNTTIANNVAFSGGGLANANSATLQNSILAGNLDANSQPSDCSGALTSQGYNLIGSTDGCTINGDTTGNLLNVDPLLGPLQDNGGPTLTHALLPGSPALDTGNPVMPGSGGAACEATDQRGVARPQDGNNDGIARCDIGAVEVQPSLLAVTIDIKPGDSKNPINLKSRGVIPVAILSTSTFDATTVEPSSVDFGPNNVRPVKSSFTDVNGDGLLDLLLHFSTQQVGFKVGDIQACLTGQTPYGTAIQGCDSIHILS